MSDRNITITLPASVWLEVRDDVLFTLENAIYDEQPEIEEALGRAYDALEDALKEVSP